MLFKSAKRRSKSNMMAQLIFCVINISVGLASPFWWVKDSGGWVKVGLNQARAFYDFSKMLTNTAKNAGYATGAMARELPEIVGLTINAVLVLLGVACLIMIIVAGIRWMTAEGNEEQVQKAKDTIKNAAFGLIVILGSYAITYFVFNALW